MRVFRLLLPLLTLGFTGCPDIAGPPEAGLAFELRQAPLAVTMEGKTLELEPYVYRDFAPISEPNGKPMIAGLRIHTSDGSPVPASIVADAMWVVRGDDVWAAVPVMEHSRAVTAPWYELVARGGPKWEPGGIIDVIVRLRSTNGGTKFLRAADEPIHQTW